MLNADKIAKATAQTQLKSDLKQSDEVDIHKIKPNPYQPRFNEDVQELKDAIEQNGLLTPITLTARGGEFVLVGGHRRYKACKELGFTKIKANVIEADDKQLQSMAIVENLQREDLHPLELAVALQNAIKNGFSRDDLGKSLGKSQSFISKCLGALKLNNKILDDIKSTKKKIGIDTLNDLQKISDVKTQNELYQAYKNGTITRDDIRAAKSKNPVKKETVKTKCFEGCIITEGAETTFLAANMIKIHIDVPNNWFFKDKEYKITVEEI